MTKVSGGNINSTRMVVQAYLNMTQTITQGVMTQQSINVNCGKKTNACNNCIKTAKKYNITNNTDYSSVCPVCFCTLENIQMSNNITIDFNAFQRQNARKIFRQQIENALTQQATLTGTKLFDNSEASTTLQTTSESMYDALKVIMNQNILQQLKNFEIINVNNPNTTLINVNIDTVVNFLSNIIQQTNETSTLLQTYDSAIISLTTKVVDNAITIVVQWMVTLFILGIVVVFSIFGINIIMNTLTLYAST